MPYVMNALDDSVSVQVHGNWFSFNPGQIKLIHNEKAAYKMTSDLGHRGLVDIPETVMEMDKASPEYKAKLSEYKRAGIIARMQECQKIWDNLEVSLRKDLQVANIQGDVYAYATEGELNALKEIKKYKDFAKASEVDRADTIRKLKEEINGNTPSTDAGTPSKGSKSNTGAAKS